MGVERAAEAIFGRPPDQGTTLALMVLHRGDVVVERYGRRPATAFGPAVDVGPESTLISWSMAKSITHAAVGIAVVDGLLDLDAPAPVPEWRGTPKETITLLDLLEMRPGLRFVEDYVDGDVSHCIAMLSGEGRADHAGYAAALPLDHEPGTVWNYSSGTTNIIARVLGDAVGGGRAGMERFLRERLFEPVGMTSAVPKFDDAGTFVGSSYVYATARDFARFGELYRADGVTATGERILPEGWLDHARTFVAHDEDAGGVPGGMEYGRHWWRWPSLPGAIVAQGYEGQYLIVDPAREVTAVHLGVTPTEERARLVSGLVGIVGSFAVSS